MAHLHPCYNHPDYAEFLRATVEDLATNHPLQGFQWGAERDGALSEVLLWDRQAHCFCEHCVARARAAGIDPERARAGFRALRGIMAGSGRPGETAFIQILRCLLRHPETLWWHQRWYDDQEALVRRLFGTIKTLRPEAETWWHIWHYQVAFDIFGRAAVDYARLADAVDVMKPVVYRQCGGDRFAGLIEQHYRQGLFAGQEAERVREVVMAWQGYDLAAEEPDLQRQREQGLSVDYVEREVARCVRDCDRRCRVVPGLGFDVPIGWYRRRDQTHPSEAAAVEAAIHAVKRAGADGILLSREYEEMRPEHLAAAGNAIRACWGRGVGNQLTTLASAERSS